MEFFGLTCIFLAAFFFVYGVIPSKRVAIKDLYDDAEDTEVRTGIILLLTPLSKKMGELNGSLRSKRLAAFRGYLKKRIKMSGNPINTSADEFLGFQQILFTFFLLFFSLFLFKLPEGNIIQQLIFIITLVVLALIIAGIFPIFILGDAIKERHKKISRELPYNLDLLTIAIEAGLDFVMAMSRVIAKGRPGPLRREFSIMMQEIKLGKRRKEALQDMSARNGHSDLKTIIAAMIQADQMGASLGPILRIQSDLLRRKRMLRAEKIAQEAPVKMLMPLIGCIFPAVFLILLVPIILKLISSL